ncbi:MAG: endonuclease III [Phycisphaerae bacterium]|jgi:endonuclease-3
MARESKKALGGRTAKIIAILKREYPDARTRLVHSNALELLIGTILAAQCTDDRVNIVTRDLFRKYRTAADWAAIPQDVLEREIRPTGFFRNKARSIRGAAARIVEVYGGQVPDTMEDLLTLPGVARKTANCVLGGTMGKSEGIVVDTHMIRVSGRLRLTRQTDPVKIERDLMEIVPRKHWTSFSHQVLFHGRAICVARKPKCGLCPLNKLCPSAFKCG